MNTGRTGSSETIYFKLADLRLHKRDVRFGLDSEVAMIAVTSLNPHGRFCAGIRPSRQARRSRLAHNDDLPSVVAIK